MGTEDLPLEVGLSVDGGFAPLSLQRRVVRITAEGLPTDQAEELRRAVDAVAAPSADAPSEQLSGMPDVMVYRVQLPGRQLVFDDVTATPEQRELVTLVTRLARQ